MDSNEQSIIAIEVYDKGIGRDDFLGKIEVKAEDIFKINELHRKWLPLQQCKSGEILISYKISSENKNIMTSIISDIEKLKEEQKELQSYIPPEVLHSLPKNIADTLKIEVSKARKTIVEAHMKGHNSFSETKEKTTTENPLYVENKIDKNTQKATGEKILGTVENLDDENPITEQTLTYKTNVEKQVDNNMHNTTEDEILNMVDDLDEESSKYIYEQLQTIICEVDNKHK